MRTKRSILRKVNSKMELKGIIFLRGQQLAHALNEHEAANIALHSNS